MLSGLFDRYPGIQVVLGHLGEGLRFTLPRLEHRLHMQRDGTGLGAAQEPVSHYFNRNFLITTSGDFHTRTLDRAIAEIGADRVMFSVDYPYETMQEAAGWFDASLLCHNDRLKVGRTNAARVFGIDPGDRATGHNEQQRLLNLDARGPLAWSSRVIADRNDYSSVDALLDQLVGPRDVVERNAFRDP